MTALPNPFLNSAVSLVAADEAGASPPPPVRDASAALSNSAMPTAESAVASKGPPVADAAAAPIPASTGGPQEAPAPRCTEPHEGAGALDVIDCIHEIFFYARKLMRGHPAFVLDEAAFMAELDEEPLFLREDGFLQRREA